MKPVYLFLIAAVAVAGCESKAVKDTYYTMDELEETKKFIGYEIIEGPGIEGPYRITSDVFSTVRRINSNEFHYGIPVGQGDDKRMIEFKREGDVKEYGFRFISVKNKNDELGVLLLRTEQKVPSYFNQKKQKAEQDGSAAKGEGSTPTKEDILQRLSEADEDGDGKVSVDELPERLREMHEKYDADGDGLLDQEEQGKFAEGVVQANAEDGDESKSPEGKSKQKRKGVKVD